VTILVVGAQGTVGRTILARCREGGQRTPVLGLSRRVASDRHDDYLALDLADKRATIEALAHRSDLDRIIFCAKVSAVGAEAERRANTAILENLLDALSEKGTVPRRFCLIHGTKWYGSHLGPYSVPAREADPRGEGPLFYFDQYDLLAERCRHLPWSMTTLRPHTVWGFSVGTGNNLVTLLAVYAALQRERGLPLDFPGPEATFRKRSQATAAWLLAEACLWAVNEERCAAEDFNITNGDWFRWCDLWPRLAAAFDMRPGMPVDGGFRAALSDAEPVWRAIVKRYGLADHSVGDLARAEYGDGLLACTWDDVSAVEKAYAAGFKQRVESADALLNIISELRSQRVVP
jgi:nucleoside-diphosphate-sugar epimerase